MSDVRWQYIRINELALWSVDGNNFALRRALNTIELCDFELQHQIRSQSIPEPITSVTRITVIVWVCSRGGLARVTREPWHKVEDDYGSLIKRTRSSKFFGRQTTLANLSRFCFQSRLNCSPNPTLMTTSTYLLVQSIAYFMLGMINRIIFFPIIKNNWATTSTKTVRKNWSRRPVLLIYIVFVFWMFLQFV